MEGKQRRPLLIHWEQFSRETILWFFFLLQCSHDRFKWHQCNGLVQWRSQMIKDPNSGTIKADWVVVEIRPRLTNTSNERRDRLWAMSDKKGETLEHYPGIWSGSLNNKPTARIQMSRVIPGKQACPPWWVGWWKEKFPWNTSRLISSDLMTFQENGGFRNTQSWFCVQSKVRLPNKGSQTDLNFCCYWFWRMRTTIQESQQRSKG